MSTTAHERLLDTPSRSASALNLIDGLWVEGRGNTRLEKPPAGPQNKP